MAATDTITIYRGEDVVLNFTMDPVEDISGWTIAFTVDGGGGYAKLIEEVGVVVNGPAGTFSVTLSAADTSIRAGVYQYDAWRTDTDSARVLAVGQFIVSDVARLPAAV